jgi:hypothetical protein
MKDVFLCVLAIMGILFGLPMLAATPAVMLEASVPAFAPASVPAELPPLPRVRVIEPPPISPTPADCDSQTRPATIPPGWDIDANAGPTPPCWLAWSHDQRMEFLEHLQRLGQQQPKG